MRMSDFKALLDTEREKEELGLALLFCVLVLSGVVFFFPPPLIQNLVTAPTPDAFANVTIEGKAAIVYDLTDGTTLYQLNADTQLPLASLTKLLTTYAAINALSPDAPVTVTAHALAQDGESGLAEGETFAFRDIARLALVASSNDAAAAIMDAATDNHPQEEGAFLSNAAAAAELSQTYAVNGTGLDENATVSGGYGSARDVALLSGALLAKAPLISEATTEPTVTVRSLDGKVHTLLNTDYYLGHFPSPLLSKTGYTWLAGGNLVVVVDVGLGHPVAVVVLDSTRDARFTDVDTLIAATLAHFASTTPATAS